VIAMTTMTMPAELRKILVVRLRRGVFIR
jgi:hypothetical protein